jgi:serine/threonine-protein kinase
MQLIVPDRDTTVSAYGGRLRRYDVHIAKMFEVSHFLCQKFGVTGYEWIYRAGNGAIPMGRFRISCSLAKDIAIAYGSGRLEKTVIKLLTSSPSSETYEIPVLSITSKKITNWLDFMQRFQPIQK